MYNEIILFLLAIICLLFITFNFELLFLWCSCIRYLVKYFYGILIYFMYRCPIHIYNNVNLLFMMKFTYVFFLVLILITILFFLINNE